MSENIEQSRRCANCGQYGRGAFPVNIYFVNGGTILACYKVMCVNCRKVEYFFTYGPGGKADFGCRGLVLPEGIGFEALKLAVEARPMQMGFYPGEIREYERNLL